MEIFRDEQITEEQLRGINFAVSVLAKSYPFITGWEFDTKTNTIFFLKLIIDLKKVEEFFDFKIEKNRVTSIFNIKSLSDDFLFMPDEEVRGFERRINSELNENYQQMPDKYKGKTLKKIYFGFKEREKIKINPGDRKDNFIELKIQEYITEPTSNQYFEIEKYGK
jgi:hypothetical protein